MRSVQDILEYIDVLYAAICDRPQAFAPCPEALESILITLEDIRAFVTEEGAVGSGLGSYANYLVSKGYGAQSFVGARKGPSSLTDADIQDFRALAAFWKGYLDTRH